MGLVRVRFEWLTGLKQPIFRNLRLVGSWTSAGHYSNQWSTAAMTSFTAEDGCPAWWAEVDLDDAQLGWTFHWGVLADTLQNTNLWAITTEVSDPSWEALRCSFVLSVPAATERYYLTHCRRLGANKVYAPGASQPSLRFSVWAPNAKSVAVVFGEKVTGYITSDGKGVKQTLQMAKADDGSGLWHSVPVPELKDFKPWDHRLYMYAIDFGDGRPKYRTDLYSRCQIGAGAKDPAHPKDGEKPWNGTSEDLDGSKSCSVIIDPDTVTELLNEGTFPPTRWLSEEQFWAGEYNNLRPVPDRLDELIIYELHVAGLANGTDKPATFREAIDLLDHLVELGFNAVGLMPTAQAEPWSWGYGTSHYFATDYAGGGRDELKHFVRACHQRGIAVILDVVYNHYVRDAERCQWMYDSAAHEKNIYYWYEGKPENWPFPEGGYLDNGSTGFTPNFRDEMVRKLFVSSAVMLVAEFHLDGFRVDLTQAMHRDNVFHANGFPCPTANQFGAKFLREWVRTLRLIKPSVILIAEDHTGWRAITQPQATGGIGFDAAWWAEWYHNLIGDSQSDLSNARLLHVAGMGGNEALAMSTFANSLLGTPRRIIYNESHDQAGNATYQEGGHEVASARTIQVAVNGFLDGNRPWAEARCRVAATLTFLTPGVPMTFMGEEVGAKEPYRYNDWLLHREDFNAMRTGEGARLFAFYRDLVNLRRHNPTIASPNVALVHVHDANRVIAFRRWLGDDDFLVVCSLNNAPFADGYWLDSGAIRDGTWVEVLNSDAAYYGGANLCNPELRRAQGGRINVRVPANGVAVFQLKEPA